MAHRSNVQKDPRRQLLDEAGPPPRVRSGPGRPLLLIGFATVLFCVLLLVVLNLDTGADERAATRTEGDIEELIVPQRLDPDAVASGMDLSVPPRTGRGIITMSKDGRIRERYVYDSLDPAPEGLPPGWLKLTRPRMEAFLADGRRLTIEGDEAVAHRPAEAIEEGTITGNVTVRLFDAPPDGAIDIHTDAPSLIVRTGVAGFENFLGRITCDGRVRIETKTMTLPGHDLSVLIDDRDNTVRLTMRRFDYIELVSTPREAAEHSGAAATPPPRSAPTAGTLTADAGRMQPSGPVAATSDAPDTAAPAPSPASALSATPPTAAEPEAQFYLLTIRDNVRIEQGEADSRRLAMGDHLEMVFSTESEGLDGALALGGATPPQLNASTRHHVAVAQRGVSGQAYGMSREAVLASLAIGTSPMKALEPEADRTIITADGPLTIVPLTEAARRPASPKDLVVELTGAPVLLCDHGNGAEAVAAMVRYGSGMRETELIGSESHPLFVTTPELEAAGERFHMNQTSGRAAMAGPGWMTRRERSISSAPSLLCAPAAEGRTNHGPPLPRRAERPRIPADRTPELHITWTGGMDLQFDDASAGEGMGPLRSAHFRGEVRVISPDFAMDSDDMLVLFPPGATDPEAIESIAARGGVRVVGVTKGTLLCQSLDLDMTQSSRGKTIPREMLATGDVHAIDGEQVMWSDSLHVTFREIEAEAETPAPPQEVAGAADTDRGDVDVDTLFAEGNVQVLMENGARAFADELHGDGAEETVTLIGEDVIVASDRIIMSRGRTLVLSRRDGKVTSDGPGEFRSYTEPVIEAAPSRTDPPVVDEAKNPVELRAAWKESMLYDSTFNDGAGSVVLRGDVDVLSEPSPLERNAMTGQSLTLEFVNVPAGRRAAAAPREERPGPPQALGERRELSRLIARREARLESHTWERDDRSDEPVVFYVSGEHIEHETKTGESLVVGAGELLIHDVRPEHEAEGLPQRTTFGSRGTTMMKWGRMLHLKPRVDEVYDITATDRVEMVHRALDRTTSWMTCDRLDAVIIRPEEAQGRTDLDMGGSAKLERVKGTGGAIITTGRREVECGEFDYNVATGIAHLIAAPHRSVSIVTTGTAQALYAQRAVWDMQRDTIRITEAVGGAPRN